MVIADYTKLDYIPGLTSYLIFLLERVILLMETRTINERIVLWWCTIMVLQFQEQEVIRMLKQCMENFIK